MVISIGRHVLYKITCFLSSCDYGHPWRASDRTQLETGWQGRLGPSNALLTDAVYEKAFVLPNLILLQLVTSFCFLHIVGCRDLLGTTASYNRIYITALSNIP